MTDTIVGSETRDIVVEEVLPHAPAAVWRALTTGDLIGRWLMAPRRLRGCRGLRVHLPDHAGGRVGWRDRLPGSRGRSQ